MWSLDGIPKAVMWFVTAGCTVLKLAFQQLHRFHQPHRSACFQLDAVARSSQLVAASVRRVLGPSGRPGNKSEAISLLINTCKPAAEKRLPSGTRSANTGPNQGEVRAKVCVCVVCWGGTFLYLVSFY